MCVENGREVKKILKGGKWQKKWLRSGRRLVVSWGCRGNENDEWIKWVGKAGREPALVCSARSMLWPTGRRQQTADRRNCEIVWGVKQP